jgi:hypothetical protein
MVGNHPKIKYQPTYQPLHSHEPRYESQWKIPPEKLGTSGVVPAYHTRIMDMIAICPGHILLTTPTAAMTSIPRLQDLRDALPNTQQNCLDNQ